MALFKFLYRLFHPSKGEQTVFIEEPPKDPEMKYLITGLGNIGHEYALTRHNMGFIVLDKWASDAGIPFTTERYGDVACYNFKGRQFWLLKPSTYMNLSGNAVRYWLTKLNIPQENLVVICDDLNIPFGTIRMKTRGSDGGHNGLKHITEILGSSDFNRIRLGIGNDFQQGGQIDFVLGKLSEEQLDAMPDIAEKVISGIKDFAFVGAEKAMNRLNTRPQKAKNDNF